MKKLFYIISLISMLGLTACAEDVLNPVPSNAVSDEQIFSSVDAATTALNSAMAYIGHYQSISLGTIMADGKEIVKVDGKEFLLEKPLRADIAFLRANIVDEFGNMVFLGTTNNFNPLMATAADYVVVEAEKLVPVGEIAPEHVHASGIYVDGIYVEK